MFSISQIRAKARETVNSTPGIFLLTVIPVGLTLIISVMRYFSQDLSQTIALAYQQENYTSVTVSYLIFPMLYSFLIGLIYLSLTYTLFQIIRKTKEAATVSDSFAIFNSPNFGKFLRTFLVKQIFLFLWNLVTYVGVVLFFVSLGLSVFFSIVLGSVDAIPEDVLALIGILFIFGFLLMIAGMGLFLPQLYAYSQVEFILFEQLEKDEYAGALAIIKESRRTMKGFKAKRCLLDLSFIGWSFLVGITFGLVGIYVFPYYYAAQMHFSQAVKDEVQVRQAIYFNQFNQPTNGSPF